jgi:antitoxin (DNA-binding transcriptional repressor) of toxin-antitoxin stability system
MWRYCDDDMEAGVRKLKAHLSASLKRVAGNETITVTDHGRPIAVLSAPIGRVASAPPSRLAG